jgi:hypothetical protein
MERRAVLADGKRMFNSPEVLIAFKDMATAINPAGTNVPQSASEMRTIDDQIAAHVKRMGDDRRAWFNDEAAQADYRKLEGQKAAGIAKTQSY